MAEFRMIWCGIGAHTGAAPLLAGLLRYLKLPAIGWHDPVFVIAPFSLFLERARCVHYLRYSNMSASIDMRPKYDSRLRKERVILIVAISHLWASGH